jgi:glyoxylase I family protein
MASQVQTGTVHHLRLIVTDMARSKEFYTKVLNFKQVVELSPEAIVFSNGSLILGLALPWDKSKALPNDRFSPHRVGLDHLSFNVKDRAALEEALAVLEQNGIEHGEITDLPPFGITILSFCDPDGIQLELSAPLG